MTDFLSDQKVNILALCFSSSVNWSRGFNHTKSRCMGYVCACVCVCIGGILLFKVVLGTQPDLCEVLCPGELLSLAFLDKARPPYSIFSAAS